jgi:hypothetical protein
LGNLNSFHTRIVLFKSHPPHPWLLEEAFQPPLGGGHSSSSSDRCKDYSSALNAFYSQSQSPGH